MAKRIFSVLNTSWAAVADATALTSGQYAAIVGGSTSQLIDILEVKLDGRDVASVVASFNLARQGTLQTGGASALVAPNSDGPSNSLTAALAAPPSTFVAAVTTQPQRSNSISDAKLDFTLNTFGGQTRWNAAPTQQWQQYGSAVTIGASVFSNSSSAGVGNTALANVSIIYEPY